MFHCDRRERENGGEALHQAHISSGRTPSQAPPKINKSAKRKTFVASCRSLLSRIEDRGSRIADCGLRIFDYRSPFSYCHCVYFITQYLLLISAFPNPQSAIRNPQSSILDPRSSIFFRSSCDNHTA